VVYRFILKAGVYFYDIHFLINRHTDVFIYTTFGTYVALRDTISEGPFINVAFLSSDGEEGVNQKSVLW